MGRSVRRPARRLMGLALWLLSFCVLGESATAARQLGTTINVGEFRVVVDSWIPGGAARGFAPVRVTAINDGLRTERLDLTLMGSINYAMRLADQGRKLRLEPGESVSLEMLVNLDRNHGQGNYTIMAASEGPNSESWRIVPALQTAPGVYDEDLLDGLDFLLAEMGKRDMQAVLCLNNI